MRIGVRKNKPHLKVATGWHCRVILIDDHGVIDWDDFKFWEQAIAVMPRMVARVIEEAKK